MRDPREHHTMRLTRRTMLCGGAGLVVVALMPGAVAFAQQADTASASSFIEEFGAKLVAIVNGEGSLSEKQQRLRPLIDSAVDVDGIAKFCLGRFNATATPQQLQEFTKLFHAVLVDNISSKIGEYRGVTFHMTESSMRGSEAYVGTIVQRPNTAATNVRWVVSLASGTPKVVDVVAEGTSLRLTQRSDYASYLSHNANNLDALISAMRRQVESS